MTRVSGELRSLSTSDGHVPDYDLPTFQPPDPADFSVYVDAYIGPRGEPGEERFMFLACSPRWLAQQSTPKGFWFTRILLMDRWDYPVVERAIGDLCRNTSGADWCAVAQQLSRYAQWEFENYPDVE